MEYALTKNKRILWVSLAFGYMIVRFGLTAQLDFLGTYASYVLEFITVGIVLFLYRKNISGSFLLNSAIVKPAVFSLLAGFSVYNLSSRIGVAIPFDFKGLELLIFLLLVAPVLEELVFRFFLWKATTWLTLNRVTTLILTSVFFSYAHLHAIWFSPSEIHGFLIYQTIYTLFLGLACGYMVFKWNSVLGAILVHFTFNLGFYLATKMPI
jgi:membrane protease YdiL (CAAX protease family)